MHSVETDVLDILRSTFGSTVKLLDFHIINDGVFKLVAKIECDQYTKPLILKLEKDFPLPRTQKYQIRREAAAYTLCRKHGVKVPIDVACDESGRLIGHPWLLEEYIEAKLAYEYKDDENRRRLGQEFEVAFSKLMTIGSDQYGDTFSGGIIGQYNDWQAALRQVLQVQLEDSVGNNIFDAESYSIIEQAFDKAVGAMTCKTRPVLFHYDLLSINVFTEQRSDGVHLGPIIDFGMSMFAPRHYAEYITRKLTDFKMEPMDVGKVFGISAEEVDAYDIIRIEPILLMRIFRFPDANEHATAYLERCKKYIIS